MIRINLLSVREARREQSQRNEARMAVLVAVLVGALLLAVEVGSRMRLNPIIAEHKSLQQQVKALDTKTAELAELDKQKAELGERLKTIAALEDKKVGPVHVLANLADATPDQVWLVEFTENNGAATVTGLALDNQTIATFMRSLAGSTYFTDVDLVETTQVEQEGLPLKRFVVRARLSYAGNPLPPASKELKYPEPPKQQKELKRKKARGA